jgi:hypothetical protein
MQQMRHIVKEHNVYRWAADLISELAEIRLETPETVESRFAHARVTTRMVETESCGNQEKAREA